MTTIPEFGTAFIGWKKCEPIEYETVDYVDSQHNPPVLCKLEIPADSQRVQAFIDPNYERKCRAERAKVLGFYSLEGELLENVTQAKGWIMSEFVYTLGEMMETVSQLYDQPYDDDPNNDCGAGINFFMTQEEARNH